METYQILLTKTNTSVATIAALSMEQIMRASLSQPNDPKQPALPDSYNDLEMAERLVESFRQEMDNWRWMVILRQVSRKIGLARILAVDNGLVPDAEREDIARLSKRYMLLNPDTLSGADETGLALFNMVNELVGDSKGIVAADLWLQRQAGLIDQAKVDEVLKSLQSESERSADPDPVGEGGAQEQTEGEAERVVVIPVRVGRRGSKVALHA